MLEAVDSFGRVDAPGIDARIAAEVVAGILGRFEAGPVRKPGPGSWQAQFVELLSRLAPDPDVHIARWLQGDTPLGIEVQIPPGGVFPEVPAGGVGSERDRVRYLSACLRPELVEGNYKSYDESREFADAELQREPQAVYPE